MTTSRIVLTGSIALDRIMVFPGKFAEVIKPEKLHVLSLSLLLDKLEETPGGIAANIAYSLALLDEKPVLLGSVGENAREYMERLKKMGVDISHLHWSSKPTASFTVMTDQADCQIGGFYPGAMGDATALKIKPVATKDSLVVISAHDPAQMNTQVEECTHLGIAYVYDVGQQVSNISGEDIKNGIAHTKLLILNDYELSVLQSKTGENLESLRKKIPLIIETLGEHGVRYYQGKKEGVVTAVKLKTVTDPTGAGDAFRAGFLYAYSQHWPLEKALQLGATVASFAVEHVGTQSHTFTQKKLAQRYKHTYGESLWQKK